MSAAARAERVGRGAAVRAVLLDAFGTLLTLESPAAALTEALRERLGVAVSEAQAGAALAAEVAFYRAHMQLGRDEASLAELRLRCGEVLRGALAVELPAASPIVAASTEQVAAVLHEALRFRVYPEVPDTLARLRAAGLKLVVVSNWDVSVQEVLTRVGLSERLDGVISSAAVGAAKPDPLPLRRGLELAGVAAGQAVHVGDSESEDVAAARAAGIRPVLVQREVDFQRRRESARLRSPESPRRHPWERPREPPLAVVGSLAELPAVLGL